MHLSEDDEIEFCSMYLTNGYLKTCVQLFHISYKRAVGILYKHGISRTGHYKYVVNENIFENIDTPEKAYWYGMLLADGSMVKSKVRGGVILYLRLIDEEHIHKFRDFLGADNPIYLDKSRCGGQTTYGIRICERYKLCNDLIKHGFIPGKKCNSLRFPNINKNLYSHFIRGFFDGDGGWSFTPQSYTRAGKKSFTAGYRFGIGSRKKSFLVCISKIINDNIGYKPRVYTTVRDFVRYYDKYDKTIKIRKTDISKYYDIKVGGKNIVKKIGDFLYRDATVYLDRKFEAFNLAYSN